MSSQIKDHWENVFLNKKPTEMSWFQEKPETSLDFIRLAKLPETARIIDVGGGDSFLIDFLLEEGYENLSLLDISSKALENVKERLGEKGAKVEFICSNVVDYQSEMQYFDFWHDRASFHFLTRKEDIDKYVELVGKSIKPGGYLNIGTFSDQGPLKCSGLEIRQYSEKDLNSMFEKEFKKVRCINEEHLTPFNTYQNFTFCSFQRK